ncbi:MAG: protein translocase SEC61 complex subunit gamma [Candidatus Diapherotrites archaeon]|nr:protein translocase SEC61 complex subunit gamma [Candidatus Diapherotrites archaeon]
MSKFSELVHQSKRVIKASKKPTTNQLKNIMRATGLGIVVIGLIAVAMKLIFILTGIAYI